MSLKGKTVIFSEEKDLTSQKPYHPGQQPVYVAPAVGAEGKRYYSSGRLERALKQGAKVYIISMLPGAIPCIQFAIDKLPPEQVLFSKLLEDIMDSLGARLGKKGFAHEGTDPAVNLEKLMAHWRTMFERLGVEWSAEYDTPAKALAKLVTEKVAVDGATLTGFASN